MEILRVKIIALTITVDHKSDRHRKLDLKEPFALHFPRTFQPLVLSLRISKREGASGFLRFFRGYYLSILDNPYRMARNTQLCIL
jgi:hypothetical protein